MPFWKNKHAFDCSYPFRKRRFLHNSDSVELRDSGLQVDKEKDSLLQNQNKKRRVVVKEESIQKQESMMIIQMMMTIQMIERVVSIKRIIIEKGNSEEMTMILIIEKQMIDMIMIHMKMTHMIQEMTKDQKIMMTDMTRAVEATMTEGKEISIVTMMMTQEMTEEE